MNVLVTADRALTSDGARGATSVLSVGGEIVLVGDPAQVAADPRAAGARRIDLSRRAMVPGTVNTHNHSFQSLLRGIGDDLPFLEWRDKALYRYSPKLGAEDMATAALFAFGEMLLHGVTTVCDFYYLNAQGNDHASATIDAARRLGMRIVLARCFYDWDGAPAAYRETVPQAILQESFLSFLGIGIQPPDVSWGLMVAQGRTYLHTAWWLSFFPGVAIVVTTVSATVLAAWARIATDPGQRWRLTVPQKRLSKFTKSGKAL